MNQASALFENPSAILVTGATGYIGGRLAQNLVDMGYNTRCMARDPDRLQGRSWYDKVTLVKGDVLAPQTLDAALKDVHTTYYLIHSMEGGSDFHQRDWDAARNFGDAAKRNGVQRIIFLGALASGDENLSEHLSSRQKTGDALRESGVPVTEFRAGVIVGSGSLSFEMIRYLTERLPVMICPKWVYTKTQPIGIRDVLAYLMQALVRPDSIGKIIEIGGANVVSYGEMMTQYAQVRELKRYLIPVPFLTPRLSSLWVNFITPIPRAIARPLIEGLKNESVVRDFSAKTIFPDIQPADYKTSVERALAKLKVSDIETSWKDALSTSQGDITPVSLTTTEGMVMETRQRVVAASPARVFSVFTSIGGKQGWWYMNWAWRIRGFIDYLVGGVGLRRGRRDDTYLRVGDALDFWRVEALEKDKLLRLRAEMKVPGKAWLQFQVAQRDDGQSVLTQTAYFAPKGLGGWLYWYGLYPIHTFIFSGMIDQIAKRALVSDEKK